MSDKHDSGQIEDNSDRPRHPDSIGAVQFAAIEAAAAADGVTFETEPADGAPHYIWQKDHILVAGDVDERIPELQQWGAELARNLDRERSKQETRPDRVKLLVLKKTTEPAITTREIVERLNRGALAGKVFLNHLLYVTHDGQDGGNLCPANEPIPVPPGTAAAPPPSPGDAGHDVRITVIDTGLSPGWEKYPWLNDNTEVFGDPEFGTFDQSYDPEVIASHAGHGVFIAGIIRCMAPRATVKVLATMHWAGAMLESEIARIMIKELESPTPPHIISLSAGCTIPDLKRKAAPAAILDAVKLLNKPGCETLLVAAAGNDAHGPGNHGRFFPAAFAGKRRYARRVVAVGALRPDREGRACFSNYGEWVTLYEDGENLINAFPVGDYVYREPIGDTGVCTYYPDSPIESNCTCVTAPVQGSPTHFDGMASWSGTSFATPLVVGRIARYMTARKAMRKPRPAAARLFSKQLEAITDPGAPHPTLLRFPKSALT